MVQLRLFKMFVTIQVVWFTVQARPGAMAVIKEINS